MDEVQIDPERVVAALTRRCSDLLRELAVLEALLSAERERSAAKDLLPGE